MSVTRSTTTSSISDNSVIVVLILLHVGKLVCVFRLLQVYVALELLVYVDTFTVCRQMLDRLETDQTRVFQLFWLKNVLGLCFGLCGVVFGC